MTTKNYRGRFVWHDVMSTDPAATKAFYSGLFGWRTEALETPMGPYEMLHLGDRPIGGIVALDPDHAPGVPSHWVGYVDVEDAEACVARSEASGGRTHMPVSEIPGVGKFAVLLDPLGGVIYPFQCAEGAERPPIPEKLEPGMFCWDELSSKDPAASMAYYAETFGWTYEDKDMGEMGTYHLVRCADGADAGGIMKTPCDEQPHAWLAYVGVESIDACHAKATELGANTIVPPQDIPGIGRFSVMFDPAGAAFAVYRSAPMALMLK